MLPRSLRDQRVSIALTRNKVSSQLTYYLRNQVPNWVTDEEAQKVQKRVWDDVAKELESTQPGCVKRVV